MIVEPKDSLKKNQKKSNEEILEIQKGVLEKMKNKRMKAPKIEQTTKKVHSKIPRLEILASI